MSLARRTRFPSVTIASTVARAKQRNMIHKAIANRNDAAMREIHAGATWGQVQRRYGISDDQMAKLVKAHAR